MKQYLHILSNVLRDGIHKDDRTGTGTIGYFGEMAKYDLREGFPLLTTKRLSIKAIAHELLWFISGNTNIKYLQDNDVKIWNEWADTDGNLGPIYGKQWRSWEGGEVKIDQLQLAIDQLKICPNSRRIIINSWAVHDLDKMKLPPCHTLMQFNTCELTLTGRTLAYLSKNLDQETREFLWDQEGNKIQHRPEDIEKKVSQLKDKRRALNQFPKKASLDHLRELLDTKLDLVEFLDSVDAPKYKLDLGMYQRSADIFLGVPFNIASYSMLLHMVSMITNMRAGIFTHFIGDCHLYENHLEQARSQLNREVRELPILSLRRQLTNIDDFVYEDLGLLGYDAHDHIQASVSV